MLTPLLARSTPVTTGNPGMPPGWVMLRCCAFCAWAARHAAASRPAALSDRSVFNPIIRNLRNLF